MVEKRLRIVLEFSPKKDTDIDMWEKLDEFSNSAAYVKDVLRGKLPPLYPINYIYTEAINMLKFEEIEEDI